MSAVAKNLLQVKSFIPTNVKLIAVSKFHPTETILEAYDTGHRIFGESRAQELADKYGQLPQDIEWHFIGHLQRNKVKQVIPCVNTIHSVDSLRLFNEIVKETEREELKVALLLQIHIAEEDSKFGLSYDECVEILESKSFKDMKYSYVAGVMGMATNTDDENKIKQEFRTLNNIFKKIKENYFAEDKQFKELSFGMSSDYLLAIEEGSTMVRVGSSIFGDREY